MEELDQKRMGRGLWFVGDTVAEVDRIAVVAEEGNMNFGRMGQAHQMFGNPKDLVIVVRMMILQNRP